MSSLEETAGPEMGVSDKGDIENVQCWGRPGPGLRSTVLNEHASIHQSQSAVVFGASE